MRGICGTIGLAACVLLAGFLMPAARPVPATHAGQTQAGTAGAGMTALQVIDWALQSAGATLATANADAVPTAINHQGVITVNGQRYTGTGYFRFAIVDPQDGDKNRWTNDGSNLNAAAMPAVAVSIQVNDGIYSTRLGESPMAPLDTATFADGSLALRVWFTHDGNNPQQLSPDHPLTSVPYAQRAESVSDESITTAALTDNVVSAVKLATDSASLSRVSGNLLNIVGSKLTVGSVANPKTLLDINAGWTTTFLRGTYPNGQTLMLTAGLIGTAVVQVGNGPLYFCTNSDGVLDNPSNARLYISNAGNVGIGSTAPSAKLAVAGNICATGTIGACSDAAFKERVRPLSHALERVNALKGVEFNWKTREFADHHFSDQPSVGFIAQEVEKILPEVVSKGSDGYLSVDYGRMTPLLVEAIKEQQNQIDRQQRLLECERQAHAEQLADLQKRLARLEAAFQQP